MIYSQTSPHNGPVHVSIRADRDASTLTFLDMLWSAALSLAPSSLFSNLRHSGVLSLSSTHAEEQHYRSFSASPSSHIPNRSFFSVNLTLVDRERSSRLQIQN